jgi:hypothetical protein
MSYEQCLKRVRNVNNILREEGYSWDEIETFWQQSIEECKEKEEVENARG